MAKVILPRQNIVRGFVPSLRQTPQEPRQVISFNPTSVAPPEHCERILLLEDEAQTNFILREYLESLGYQVVAVANGVEGLKEVIKSNFELVICDMMMPQLPGDMFYLAVQKTRPQLCNRFVFITGHQENPTVDAFIQRTNSVILVKPFRLQQLELALEGILSRFQKNKSTADLVSSNEETTTADSEAKESPSPSVVSRVIRMVGLSQEQPEETGQRQPSSPPPQAPKISPLLPHSPAKNTRRIAHLASAPIMPPTTPSASQPAKSRVTRKVAAEKKVPEKIAPKVSRTIRVTRKLAAPVAATTPKVTRKVADTILRVPQTKFRVAPKTTIKIPVKTATSTSKKVTAKVTTKVAAKVTRKVTKTLPAPAVTRRISSTKKSS